MVEEFKCPKCDRIFDSKEALEMHIAAKHSQASVEATK
jgi:uncharacterized C2H2 Zn-finger protein